jgi:streptomycin 6-kinase
VEADRFFDTLADERMAELEATAHAAAAEWGVELGERFALARYSFVAAAGTDAVLKVTPAEDDESDEEADALALWDGDGAVRLLRHDRARRALLIERAVPGYDASTLPDQEATAVAVEIGLKLWRPAGEQFRWIGDHVPRWLDNAERDRGEGAELIPLARRLYEELEPRDDTLVHGDFHHHNLLRHGDRWVAIDAKAMRGEPEYDIPSFLWNPIPYQITTPDAERRLAPFAAAGLDDWRMRAWAVVRGAFLGATPEEAAVLRALLG